MADIEKTVTLKFVGDASSAESTIDSVQKKTEKFAKNVEKSEKGAFAAQKSAVNAANQSHSVNQRRSKVEDRVTKTHHREVARFRKDEKKFHSEEAKHLQKKIDAYRKIRQVTGSSGSGGALSGFSNRISTWWNNRRRPNGPGGPNSPNGPNGPNGPGGPNTPNGPGGGASSRSGGGSGILSMMRSPAALGLAAIGAIGSYVGGQISNANREFLQYDRVRSNLAGMDYRSIEDENLFNRSKSLGYSRIELAGQAHGIARQTGSTKNTLLAQELSRSGAGLGVEEIGSFMGQLTRSGNRMDGRGTQVLNQVMRNAVSSGLDRSRTGEHLDSVASVIQDVSNSAGNRTVDASGISALLAAAGKLGGAAFQGSRGLGLLSQVDAGIKGMGQWGRNDAPQSVALQAAGYGMPGSGVSLIDAHRKLQRGLFTDPEGGIELFGNMIRMVERNTDGGDSARAQLAEMLPGMNFDELDAITGLYKSGNTEALKEKFEELKREQQPLQSIEEVLRGGILANIEEVARLSNRGVRDGEILVDEFRQLRQLWHDSTDPYLAKILSVLESTLELMMEVGKSVGLVDEDFANNILTEQRERERATEQRQQRIRQRDQAEHLVNTPIDQLMIENPSMSRAELESSVRQASDSLNSPAAGSPAGSVRQRVRRIRTEPTRPENSLSGPSSVNVNVTTPAPPPRAGDGGAQPNATHLSHSASNNVNFASVNALNSART